MKKILENRKGESFLSLDVSFSHDTYLIPVKKTYCEDFIDN